MSTTHKPFEEMNKRELIKYINKLESMNIIDVNDFVDKISFIGLAGQEPENAKDIVRQAIQYGKKDDFDLTVTGDGTTLKIEATFSYEIETHKLNMEGK